MPRKLHRWINPPARPSRHLSIRTCANCKLQKHSHHESEGGRDVHWSTFHLPDGTRVRGHGTPECTGYVPVRATAAEEAA